MSDNGLSSGPLTCAWGPERSQPSYQALSALGSQDRQGQRESKLLQLSVMCTAVALVPALHTHSHTRATCQAGGLPARLSWPWSMALCHGPGYSLYAWDSWFPNLLLPKGLVPFQANEQF